MRQGLPQIDRLLRSPGLVFLLRELPRWAVVAALRKEVARLREQLQQTGGALPGATVSVDEQRIATEARRLLAAPLRRVLNGTGVVLHTNLGRAPLPQAAAHALGQLSAGYLNLEYRLADGVRGSRQEHLHTLLQTLTGAQAHVVVNNNAAAVLLMLAGLVGSGGEVILSRGELVEIGGSFRIPDVMRESGALLREVGTTNRTHGADYQKAIGHETRAVLKVHRSNFAQVGYVKEVGIEELTQLAHKAGVRSLYDLGSGLLTPQLARALGCPSEPTVRGAIEAGCDVVCFSCDKLLGGPQAGVLAGTEEAIGALKAHPLLRALRPDKLTLIALHETLRLLRDELDSPAPLTSDSRIPALAMMLATPSVLEERALQVLEWLSAREGAAALPRIEVLPCRSAVGGGSLPLHEPPSVALSPKLDAQSSRRLEAILRGGDPPVIGRMEDDRLLIDLRALSPDDLPLLAAALHTALGQIVAA